MVNQFHQLISAGPDYVCTCCTQTFFKHSVRNVAKLKGKRQVATTKYLTNYRSFDDNEWICVNCLNSICKGNIPKLWLHNGLQFPERPPELALTQLEERLVAPRLPFMQLREMPRGWQLNLRGNIVNVPADVNSTIKSLPRILHDKQLC